MSDAADTARQDDAVGLDEAARRLGVSTTTLRRRLAAGAIPGAFREPGPRGVWRLPLEALADDPAAPAAVEAGAGENAPAEAAPARELEPDGEPEPDTVAVGSALDRPHAVATATSPPTAEPDRAEPVGVVDLLTELTRLTGALTEERRLLGMAAEERESVRIEALRARRMLQHAIEDREDARIEAARLETMLELERARVEELRAELERLRGERDRLQGELDAVRRPRFRR